MKKCGYCGYTRKIKEGKYPIFYGVGEVVYVCRDCHIYHTLIECEKCGVGFYKENFDEDGEEPPSVCPSCLWN